MNGRCKEPVWNGYTVHLCSRKDWKDGYCKQHHPDSVKKRREDADARYKAKMAAVAETQYQAKLAEDTALQDQQRWQREEIARLRLENERLREIVSRWTAHHRGCGMIIGNLCNCGLDTAIDALLREETT